MKPLCDTACKEDPALTCRLARGHDGNHWSPRGKGSHQWPAVTSHDDWTDDDWSALAECCDGRDHHNATEDAQCMCTEHPNSHLHPFGIKPWPAS